MLNIRFKQNCVTSIRKLIEKLQERSTLKYSILRDSTSFSPIEMVRNKEECPLKLKNTCRLIDFYYHHLLSSYKAFNFNPTNLQDFSS